MPLRTLVLKRELLTELTAAELTSVAGADAVTPGCTVSPLCYTVEDVRCLPSQLVYPCIPTERCTAGC